MPFFTIGYYPVRLDFLWFFWRFLTRFLCFFSYLSFLWHVDIPLFNRRFFSFFGKFFNSALFFEKHHVFDFQLFHHCLVFCKSTSFSLFFCSDFPRREISISPAMRGWGKDCRNICTMGNLLGRKSRHLWFYFFLQ